MTIFINDPVQNWMFINEILGGKNRLSVKKFQSKTLSSLLLLKVFQLIFSEWKEWKSKEKLNKFVKETVKNKLYA
jgi:hypothetical protein